MQEVNQKEITLDTFIGQRNIVEALKVSALAAKKRNEPMCHVLLCGARGSGKNTIIHALACELDTTVRTVSFINIKDRATLAATLTSLEEKSILHIENFEAIKQDCVDLLCSAMDDFCIELTIGKGASARIVRIDLSPFTLVATIDTSDTSVKLPTDLLNSFPVAATMTDYTFDELKELAKKFISDTEVTITEEGTQKAAFSAKGSYRKMTNMLKRARDFAAIKGNGVITADVFEKAIGCFFEDVPTD